MSVCDLHVCACEGCDFTLKALRSSILVQLYVALVNNTSMNTLLLKGCDIRQEGASALGSLLSFNVCPIKVCMFVFAHMGTMHGTQSLNACHDLCLHSE